MTPLVSTCTAEPIDPNTSSPSRLAGPVTQAEIYLAGRRFPPCRRCTPQLLRQTTTGTSSSPSPSSLTSTNFPSCHQPRPRQQTFACSTSVPESDHHHLPLVPFYCNHQPTSRPPPPSIDSPTPDRQTSSLQEKFYCHRHHNNRSFVITTTSRKRSRSGFIIVVSLALEGKSLPPPSPSSSFACLW